MFRNWVNNIQLANTASTQPESYWIERLSALLLVEIARSDSSIDEQEFVAIKQALSSSSPTMTTTEIQDIIATATQDADAAISLHAQFQQINDSFSRDQKRGLIEQMWRVAMADGDLDKYEEYTIRELSERLRMRHKDFIQAKLKVIESQ